MLRPLGIRISSRLRRHVGDDTRQSLRLIGRLTLAGHFLHGPQIQFDQQRLFPFSQNIRADGSDIRRRQ